MWGVQAQMMTLMVPLRQNDDVLTLWRLRDGRLETLSKYCCKILEIMNKLMNFFMNHGLIFLNTAPTPQNIFLMIIEKTHILIIWIVSKSHQSTHILFKYDIINLGGESRPVMILMIQGGPKLAQSWWRNIWTFPKS